MKKGNYSNFTLDLKCRLLDLEYTQSTQAFSANTTNSCNNQPQQQKPVLSMQAIQQAITATKLMIDTLESSTSQINNMTSNHATEAADTMHRKRKKTSKQEDELKQVAKEQHSIDPPKDYKPKCIDTLYPVAHFERKLRSLAQLCQEPDELDGKQDTEQSGNSQSNSHIKRPSITQKTAAMIPLVFSMIEPSSTPSMSVSSSSATTTTITSVSQLQRPTFANAITHDMYAEAIKYIQDMTHCLGKSSVVLDVNEEEELFLDPKSSALTFGRTFMLNMDNPQPRE